MPYCDVDEFHSLQVDAEPRMVYEAIGTLDLARSASSKYLFKLRGLAGLMRARGKQATITLDDMVRAGFVPLSEEDGQEIVLGLIGRFWRPRSTPVDFAPEAFESFSTPGYAKAVLNFVVEPAGRGSAMISTETRVVATSPSAKRLLQAYWLAVKPFSSLIRKEALRIIKHDAEKAFAPWRHTEDV
jgi:hypothetical protein